VSDESLFEFGFTHNRKLRRLSDVAFRLWVTAIDVANEDGTDGLVTPDSIDVFTKAPKTGKERETAIAELVDGGLWHPVDGGWVIHDFLKHQESAEGRTDRKAMDRRRMRLSRNRKSYVAFAVSNGATCRYCGVELIDGSGGSWSSDDQKRWACLDHIVPRCQGGSDSDENLALSCWLCNSKKGGRTPEQAGMVLR